jgi:hypothetical protein
MLSFLTSLFNACKSLTGGYIKEDGQVYWSGGTLSAKKYMVKNADYNSFKVLSKDFGRDKNHTYYQNVILPNADPKTFKPLGNNYAKDKNAAYFEQWRIDGSDPNTFNWFNVKETNGVLYTYAKDKNWVYYQSFAISNDPQNFEVLSAVNYIFKDSRQVFFKNQTLLNADAASFEALKFPDYTASNIFYTAYFKDKHRAYFANKNLVQTIEGTDAASFELVSQSNAGNAYAKDKKHLYFNGNKVPNADVKTLEILPNKQYFRDQNFYYLYQAPFADYAMHLPIRRNSTLSDDLVLMDSFYTQMFKSIAKVERLAYELAQKHYPPFLTLPHVLCLPTELGTYQNLAPNTTADAFFEQYPQSFGIFIEVEWKATSTAANDTQTLKNFCKNIINDPELKKVFPHNSLHIRINRENLDYVAIDEVWVKPEYATPKIFVTDDMITSTQTQLMLKQSNSNNYNIFTND